jgi:hypothetical protein
MYTHTCKVYVIWDLSLKLKKKHKVFEFVLRIGHLQVISLMILHIKYQPNNNTFNPPYNSFTHTQ